MKRTHKKTLKIHDTFAKIEKTTKKQRLIRKDILTSKKLIQNYMQHNDIDGIMLS